MKKKNLKLSCILALSLGFAPSTVAQEPEDTEAINKAIEESLGANKNIFEKLINLSRHYKEVENLPKASHSGTSTFETCQQYAKMDFQGFSAGKLSIESTPGFEWEKMTRMVHGKDGKGVFLEHWKNVAAYLFIRNNQNIIDKIDEQPEFSQSYIDEKGSNITIENLVNYVEGKRSNIDDHHLILAAYNEYSDANYTNIINTNALEIATEVKNCVAFAKITADNFDKEERYQEEEYKTAETKKSFDGKIKCKLMGPETVDFDECDSLLTIYNGSAIAIAGNSTLQQVQASNFASEGNMKLMKGSQDPDSSATLALEVQKEGISKQKSMAHTRQALQAAKLTLMLERASSFPKQDDIIEMCKSNETMKLVSDKVNFIAEWLTADTQAYKDNRPADSLCSDVLNSGIKNGLLQNSDQLDTIYALSAEAGIEAAKETVVASQLGRQEDMIDGVIDKVNDAEVLDLPAFAGMTDDQIANYCDANPQAPECLGFAGRTVGGFTTPGLSVTAGFGQNELYNDTSTEVESNPNAIVFDEEAKDSVNANRAIGSTNKSSGFKDSAPGAAKVTSQVSGGGGSGGGGGGVSGGALSGGSGGGGSSQAAQAGTKRKSKLAYGGGGRKLSFGGGRSTSKRSSSKSGNPFAKMFDKQKASKNGVLNFRNVASQGVGGKAGNIFDRISSKYSDVSSKDRLLKYENAK